MLSGFVLISVATLHLPAVIADGQDATNKSQDCNQNRCISSLLESLDEVHQDVIYANRTMDTNKIRAKLDHRLGELETALDEHSIGLNKSFAMMGLSIRSLASSTVQANESRLSSDEFVEFTNKLESNATKIHEDLTKESNIFQKIDTKLRNIITHTNPLQARLHSLIDLIETTSRELKLIDENYMTHLTRYGDGDDDDNSLIEFDSRQLKSLTRHSEDILAVMVKNGNNFKRIQDEISKQLEEIDKVKDECKEMSSTSKLAIQLINANLLTNNCDYLKVESKSNMLLSELQGNVKQTIELRGQVVEARQAVDSSTERESDERSLINELSRSVQSLQVKYDKSSGRFNSSAMLLTEFKIQVADQVNNSTTFESQLSNLRNLTQQLHLTTSNMTRWHGQELGGLTTTTTTATGENVTRIQDDWMLAIQLSTLMEETTDKLAELDHRLTDINRTCSSGGRLIVEQSDLREYCSSSLNATKRLARQQALSDIQTRLGSLRHQVAVSSSELDQCRLQANQVNESLSDLLASEHDVHSVGLDKLSRTVEATFATSERMQNFTAGRLKLDEFNVKLVELFKPASFYDIDAKYEPSVASEHDNLFGINNQTSLNYDNQHEDATTKVSLNNELNFARENLDRLELRLTKELNSSKVAETTRFASVNIRHSIEKLNRKIDYARGLLNELPVGRRFASAGNYSRLSLNVDTDDAGDGDGDDDDSNRAPQANGGGGDGGGGGGERRRKRKSQHQEQQSIRLKAPGEWPESCSTFTSVSLLLRLDEAGQDGVVLFIGTPSSDFIRRQRRQKPLAGAARSPIESQQVAGQQSAASTATPTTTTTTAHDGGNMTARQETSFDKTHDELSNSKLNGWDEADPSRPANQRQVTNESGVHGATPSDLLSSSPSYQVAAAAANETITKAYRGKGEDTDDPINLNSSSSSASSSSSSSSPSSSSFQVVSGCANKQAQGDLLLRNIRSQALSVNANGSQMAPSLSPPDGANNNQRAQTANGSSSPEREANINNNAGKRRRLGRRRLASLRRRYDEYLAVELRQSHLAVVLNLGSQFAEEAEDDARLVSGRLYRVTIVRLATLLSVQVSSSQSSSSFTRSLESPHTELNGQTAEILVNGLPISPPAYLADAECHVDSPPRANQMEQVKSTDRSFDGAENKAKPGEAQVRRITTTTSGNNEANNSADYTAEEDEGQEQQVVWCWPSGLKSRSGFSGQVDELRVNGHKLGLWNTDDSLPESLSLARPWPELVSAASNQSGRFDWPLGAADQWKTRTELQVAVDKQQACGPIDFSQEEQIFSLPNIDKMDELQMRQVRYSPAARMVSFSRPKSNISSSFVQAQAMSLPHLSSSRNNNNELDEIMVENLWQSNESERNNNDSRKQASDSFDGSINLNRASGHIRRLTMRFRTQQAAGLLLHHSRPDHSAFTSVYISGGRLMLAINFNKKVHFESHIPLNDGRWHSIHLMIRRQLYQQRGHTDLLRPANATSAHLNSSLDNVVPANNQTESPLNGRYLKHVIQVILDDKYLYKDRLSVLVEPTSANKSSSAGFGGPNGQKMTERRRRRQSNAIQNNNSDQATPLAEQTTDINQTNANQSLAGVTTKSNLLYAEPVLAEQQQQQQHQQVPIKRVLYFGGVEDKYIPLLRNQQIPTNLHGCLADVTINEMALGFVQTNKNQAVLMGQCQVE